MLRIYKARRIGGRIPYDMHIEAIEEIPDMSVIEASETFKLEARKLFDALQSSLPGGTLSKLHAIMAMHYSNDLCIATERLEMAFAMRHRGSGVLCDFIVDDLSETNIDRFLPLA